MKKESNKIYIFLYIFGNGIPVSGSGGYLKQFVKAFYMEDTENYTAHHNLVYDIQATNSLHLLDDYPKLILESGLIYFGPRFNELTKEINFYNNTAFNYDTNINIWHIEIDNYQELGLEHNGGKIENANFINNAFEEVHLSINYQTKIMDANCNYISNLPNANGFKSFSTLSFEDFDERVDSIDYHFNPKNNILLNKEQKNNQYVDTTTGNFRLKSNSILKNKGILIKGITQEGVNNPDVGALEGSDRVLFAGSNIKEVLLFKNVC